MSGILRPYHITKRVEYAGASLVILGLRNNGHTHSKSPYYKTAAFIIRVLLAVVLAIAGPTPGVSCRLQVVSHGVHKSLTLMVWAY